MRTEAATLETGVASRTMSPNSIMYNGLAFSTPVSNCVGSSVGLP